MDNKVLVKIVVLELDSSYDVFIPVNEQVWKITRLVAKSIYDLSGFQYNPVADKYILVNKNTGLVYANNSIVYDSDIRNGTELLMVPIKA